MILATIYLAGFAGLLMFAAWLHVKFWPLGGLFNPKATQWLLVVAVLWPFAMAFFILVFTIGPLAESSFRRDIEKHKAEKEIERQWVVHAGRGEMPIHPPYDGSQKRKRYWKKVKFVDGAVSLKRESRGPRSRT